MKPNNIGVPWHHGVILAGAAILVVFLAACGGGGNDPIVIKMEGKEIPLSIVISEFNRVNGDESYDGATPGERLAFAQTLAHKEVVLSEAHKMVKGPSKVAQVQIRRYKERRILGAFWGNAMSENAISPDSLAFYRNLFGQERLISRIQVGTTELAQELIGRIQNGESFESLAREYSSDTESRDSGGRVGWIQYDSDGWQAMAPVIFTEIQKGEFSRMPLSTLTGYHIIRVDDIRMRESSPEKEKQWEAAAIQLYNQNLQRSIRDKMLQSRSFLMNDDALRIIRRGFYAFWDSLNAIQTTVGGVEYRELDPPGDKYFNSEELSTTLFTYTNRGWSIADFLESLNYCDLEFWPNKSPTVEATALYVRRRMFRWFAVEECEERGWDKDAYVVDAVDRYTERMLLDDYHTQVLAKEVAPTDEEIRVYYEAHKADFLKHDMVDFGCILYPAGEKERAQRATGRLRQGHTWESVGQEESVILPDVRFIPATGLTQGDAFPEFAHVAKQLVDSGKLPLNTYSDPVEVVGTWAVFRVTSRVPGEPLAWEVAKIFTTKMLVDEGVDRLLATKLPLLCKAYKLEINEEPLKEAAS